MGSSRPRDWTHVSCIGRQILYCWVTREAQLCSYTFIYRKKHYIYICNKIKYAFIFSSVAQSCLTLCYAMGCSMPGFPVHHHSWSLLKLMSIESVMPSNHLILCRHPLLPLPSVFPSIRVFSNLHSFTEIELISHTNHPFKCTVLWVLVHYIFNF